MPKTFIQQMLTFRRLREATYRACWLFFGIAWLITAGFAKINAATIGVDLGPTQVLSGETAKLPFGGLNGTLVSGTVSVDFRFANNNFVRLFNASSSVFDALLVIQTTGAGALGFLSGTGHLIDARGNAIAGVGVTGIASGSDGTLCIGLFPLAGDKTGAPFYGLQRPVDFYGVHFDLTFPSSPLNTVTGGYLLLVGNGKPFGVGPGVPADIISQDERALLGNISTRAFVQTGDNVLIGGFIITGTQNKRVLLRAIGPSLPLSGQLMNPVLELRNSSGALIAINDNWGDASNHQDISNTGAAPTNALESAILSSLAPGRYTAIVRGIGDTTGIALVEGYDLDRTTSSKFANISTRGLVETGDNVMIGGFIVLGGNSQKVVIRATGPSLPLAGKLADPTLELYNAQGTSIAYNDNWATTQQAEIIAAGIPPVNSLESAIVRTLTPGRYTTIVRGVNGATGLALVEIYALN